MKSRKLTDFQYLHFVKNYEITTQNYKKCEKKKIDTSYFQIHFSILFDLQVCTIPQFNGINHHLDL